MVRADMENLFSQYHIIARYYNWSRTDIKRIPSKERALWVDKIIEHENRMNGGGDEESDKASGD